MLNTFPFQIRARLAVHKPWMPAGVLMLVLNAFPVFAQQEPSLETLLFDPVAIVILPADASTDASYTASELTTLPQVGAQSLSSLLSSTPETSPSLVPSFGNYLSLRDVQRYRDQLLELEKDEGHFSSALTEVLVSLANHDVSEARYDEAIQRYRRALDLTRRHQGLYSLAQAPIITQLAGVFLLQGDLNAANELHDYLFYIRQKNHDRDSDQYLDALQDYADWNLHAFDSSNQYPIGGSGQQSFIDRITFRQHRLINAHSTWLSIARTLEETAQPDDPRIPGAELTLAMINTTYALWYRWPVDGFSAYSSLAPGVSTADQIPVSSSLGYRQGLEALERRLAYYDRIQETDPATRLMAEMDVIGWKVSFNRKPRQAMNDYEDSYKRAAAELGTDAAKAFYESPLPTPWLSFIPRPYSRQYRGIEATQALEYSGYIDMQIELDRYGTVTGLTPLGASPDTRPEVEARLLSSLRNTLFRPRLEQGLARKNDTLTLRYYYAY